MTTPTFKQACIFGGTGFIGRQLVRELAHQGYIVRVITRVPERAFFLKTAGSVGQIVPIFCDYSNEGSVRAALKGCDVVINCLGLLYERRKNDFHKVHVQLPAIVAKLCVLENVSRLIHVSALGCDEVQSKYGKTKHEGENAVLSQFPQATVIRPGVVFGVEDNFFNKFAKMSVVLPFLPLIGGGKTRVQPVYVGDIALAVTSSLQNAESCGETYELGGPEILSFHQIYNRLFEHTGRQKILLTMPWGIAKIKGSILGLLPSPMLTADQVITLKSDSIVKPGAKTFANLGIVPVSLDAILPTYLSRYRPGGRFGDKKRA